MKNREHPGRLVAQLRHTIGKSQSQFAAMIGASKHTIISLENRRNGLSRNLAKRIEIATGANLLGGKLESPFKESDYTPDDFKRWRDKFSQTNRAAALKQFDEMKTWLKVLFLAAGKSGRAGNRDRLPAVSLSLAEWLNEARQKFKLVDEIERVLEDEERFLMTWSHSISTLLENPDRSKKELAEHGIDFNKIKKVLKKNATDGFLFIQDEYRDTWSPGRSSYEILCRPRKLIPEAKCWIKKFKGSADSLLKYGDSHPELREYVEQIGEDLSFAESEYAQNVLKS